MICAPRVSSDVLRDGFDGASGADRHEDGGFYGLVGQDDLRAAAARRRIVEDVEVETHLTIVAGWGLEPIQPWSGRRYGAESTADVSTSVASATCAQHDNGLVV